MKKRAFSLLMVLAMLFTMLPANAFAAGSGTAEDPYQVGTVITYDTVSAEAPTGAIVENSYWVPTDVPATYDMSEPICGRNQGRGHRHSTENGCYAVATAAYTYWTLTAIPEEGLSYDVAITVRMGRDTLRYVNVYIEGTDDYETTNGQGVATFSLPNGTYTAYASVTVGRDTYSGTVTFTVADGAVTETLELTKQEGGPGSGTAQEIYDATTNFDHVDIRVNGSFTMNGVTYDIKLKNVELLVTAGGTTIVDNDYSKDTSETYEWRATGISVPKSAVVSLIFDIVYNGETIRTDYTCSFSGEAAFVQAIEQCDQRQGLDFIIDPTEIIEVVLYEVSYQWSNLPDGLAQLPAGDGGYAEGDDHAIDTTYQPGEYVLDLENGKMYTFIGWEEYTTEEDDHATSTDIADTDTHVQINHNTIIYGVWEVSDLPQVQGYLTIDKSFTTSVPTGATNGLYFRVVDPTGTIIDIDWPAMTNGSYNLPIYVDGTYTITESGADVAGYSRTTTAGADGNDAAFAESGSFSDVAVSQTNAVSVAITLPYSSDLSTAAENDPVHLGTVSFSNGYEKITGEPVHSYPTLLINKLESGTANVLSGAVFTLTDSSGKSVTSAPTSASGYTSFANLAPGTYSLVETTAPEGHIADPLVHTVTVAQSGAPTEQLVDGKFVQLYSYDIAVTHSDGSACYHFSSLEDRNRLAIYNEKIQGTLTISKEFAGDMPVSEIPSDFVVEVDVSGPNGYFHEITLSAANSWTDTLSGLAPGQYSISENTTFAAIQGYTHSVSYSVNGGSTSTDAPSITVDGENTRFAVELTNTYTRNEGDDIVYPAAFTVKKVDNTGAVLAGAVFALYDSNGTEVARRTTDDEGLAIFGGLYGTFDSDGDPVDAAYTLKEIQAPANYQLTGGQWTVTITEDDGVPQVHMDSDSNLFVDIWNWIIHGITPDTYNETSGVLTVVNQKIYGELTVSKAFGEANELTIPADYTVDVKVEGPNGYSKIVTLSADNEWSVPLTNLELGEYTLTEDLGSAAVAGYSLEVLYPNDGKVTLSADSRIHSMMVTNTYTRLYGPVEVSVTKVWANDDGEARPASIEVTLLKDGAEYDAVTLNAANNWTHTWSEGLTEEHTWTVDEVSVPDNYTKRITNEGYEYTITNTYVPDEPPPPPVPETIDVSVEKVWHDENYPDRPSSVDVTLYRNGRAYDTVNLNEVNGWYHTWTDLSDEYAWTVDEPDVPAGYTKTISVRGDSYTITNTRVPQMGELAVEKVWHDEEYPDRPASVDVVLYRDGTVYDTVTLSAENGWSHIWTDLSDVYEWTIDEPVVPADYTKTIRVHNGIYTITNTRVPQMGELAVEKLWHDDDYPGRPESIDVTLFRNGEVYETVTLSDENGWSHLWTDLSDVYEWTIDELEVPLGYEKSLRIHNGIYTVTNTRAPQMGELAVEKVWHDGDYSGRPESIDVTLYRNGEAYETVTLSDANGWSHIWLDLSDVYEWTIDEPNVPADYEKSIEVQDNLYIITNTRVPQMGELAVEKVWADNDYAHRPESIDVTLYRDGEAYETVTLSGANGWSHLWTDLPDVYEWTIDESAVPEGYAKSVEVQDNTYIITNTLIDVPETITITVNKVWRVEKGTSHPSSVTVTLFRDGEAYETVTLNAANGWDHSWTVTDEYTWRVDETAVPAGYTKKVTQNGYHFTITNYQDDIPVTGDNTMLGLWTAFTMCAGAAFVCTLGKFRKKEHELR